jgi:WD40 repeat protein
MIRRVLLLTLLFSTVAVQMSYAQYFAFGKNRVHYQNHEWHYLQSKHFDVYYYEGGLYLGKFTADAAEDAYNQIAKDFGHEISDRIPILVYQNHNEFAVNNAAPLPDYAEGIGGVTETFKNRIVIPFTGDYGDYRRLIHHELTHAVVNDMFFGGSVQNIIQNRIQLDLPLWFNEGIAEYEAQGWDTNSDMYVRDAIMNSELDPLPRLDGYFAYRGGQSVWDYISEQYGREKIGEIMQKMRLTRSVEGAFKDAMGLSLKDMNTRWQSTLKKVYWPEIATRENLNDIGKALITAEKGYLYNTAPAISPQGDQFAFISTKDGFFDIYLARSSDGKIIRKLANGQDNNRFESLKLLTPGITWNPQSTEIAVAVKVKESDAIAIIDVKTKRNKEFHIAGTDAILSMAWHPNGKILAVSASKDAQSDIYLLNMETGESNNLTNDLFSDLEPSWSPDGSFLLFQSDRGTYTKVATQQEGNFNMMTHNFAQTDIYKLTPGKADLQRITTDDQWDEKSPKLAEDGNQMLFISDRNGIYNLYVKDLTTGVERPVTNVITGITQVSISADGKKAVVNSLEKGTPSVFLLKDVFSRMQSHPEPLVANVWAQRVMQEKDPRTPSLAMVDKDMIQQNPILRDAVDGVPFAYKSTRPGNIYASRTPVPMVAGNHDASSGTSSTPLASKPTKPTGIGTNTSPIAALGSNGGVVPTDTTRYGGTKVDFRNYVFSPAFDKANDDRFPEDVNRFAPIDNVDSTGAYLDKKYKLKFTTDLINGGAGFNTLYGVQGNTTFAFSDMLGNHQLVLQTNLQVDLKNSDYVLAYTYLPKRTDWTFIGFHNANYLALSDANSPYGYSYYRFRSYGGGVALSYPFDKFRRVDMNLSMVGLRQTNVTTFAEPTSKRSYFYPSISYSKDVTLEGLLAPSSGYRYGISLQGSPGGIKTDKQIQFATLLGDFRWYKSLARYYTFVVRASGGVSVGGSPQLFYTSGSGSYWINRKFDQTNEFPILDVADFELALPVAPMRGFSLMNQYGSNFGLVNAEFRFPLIAALLPGPIPLIPLYNIQGVAFMDAGSVWGGRNKTNTRFDLFKTDATTGERLFDDLRMAGGFGLRTIVLNMPVQLDIAYPFDGKKFGTHLTMLSIGLDF